MAFTAAIFFDNDLKHIRNFREKLPTIRAVKINETYPTYPAPRLDDPESSISKYIKAQGLEDNFYVKLLTAAGEKIENFDEVSGMNDRDINILENWIEVTNDQENRAAIFDWDRTITMFEGFAFPSSKEDITITELYKTYIDLYKIDITGKNVEEDILIYLCGGLERLASLRQMFNSCMEHNIDIVILTNTPACDNRFYVFRTLLNHLINPLPEKPVTFICSVIFRGNKVNALLSDERFAGFARPTNGGKRNIKTKKNKKAKKGRKSKCKN